MQSLRVLRVVLLVVACWFYWSASARGIVLDGGAGDDEGKG